MKKIILAIMTVVLALTVGAATPTFAACSSPKDCVKSGLDAAGGNSSGTQKSASSIIKTIVNALLFILGAIAVIMIVIGGIKYTTSNGDASAVSGAKNTILYAVIGLLIAISAYAIVNFVVARF